MTKDDNYKLNTGDSIPVIGFGTWMIDGGMDAYDAVLEALEVGYRLIDTAKLYGNEDSVGQAIRDSNIARQDIFVTTKLWVTDMGYESAVDAFQQSYDLLGLDYIDLYLIHSPSGDRLSSWKALIEKQKTGKVKNIGVSNYQVSHLEEIMNSEVVPSVNQIVFNPFIYQNVKDTTLFCQQNDILVEAYSPLNRGRNINHPEISKIARSKNKTNAQVMLRWCLQHQTLPIPKSTSRSRMEENIDIFDFELTPGEMQTLDNI